MASDAVIFLPQNQIIQDSYQPDLSYKQLKFINDQIFLNVILFAYFISCAIILMGYLYKIGIFDDIAKSFSKSYYIDKILPTHDLQTLQPQQTLKIEEIKNDILKIEDKSIIDEKKNETLKTDTHTHTHTTTTTHTHARTDCHVQVVRLFKCARIYCLLDSRAGARVIQ